MRRFNYYDDEEYSLASVDDLIFNDETGYKENENHTDTPVGKKVSSVNTVEENSLSTQGKKAIKISAAKLRLLLKKIYSKAKSDPIFRQKLIKFAIAFICILVIIIFIGVLSHKINYARDNNERFIIDAGSVCTEYISEYGTVKSETMDSTVYGEDMVKLTGLCYARQIDFDNDSSPELLLAYYSKNVYYLEVWGYNGDNFCNIYSKSVNTYNDDSIGDWITLYHKNNKYYIGEFNDSESGEMLLMGLKHDEFSQALYCSYDPIENIYSVDGEIDAQNFETIRLCVITSSAAELLIDNATTNIDALNADTTVEVQAKTDEQLQSEAYADIISERIAKYGEPKVVEDSDTPYIDGVAVVRLIDFNNDGSDELFIVYRKMLKHRNTSTYSNEYVMVEEPTYCIEAYAWNRTAASRIFTKDNATTLFSNEDANLIILQSKNQKFNICMNTYSITNSYCYTATSKIYKMKDGEFTASYEAKIVDNYGYYRYYLNDETSYKYEFDSSGYDVPYFMSDTADYDDAEFEIIYLSALNSQEYQSTVSTTQSVINSFVTE